jgi:hypothetical protein
MYEGGRQGQKRLAADYGGEDSDEGGAGGGEWRDKAARDQLASLIKKQFRLRKGGSAAEGDGEPEEKKRDKEEERVLSYAKAKIMQCS